MPRDIHFLPLCDFLQFPSVKSSKFFIQYSKPAGIRILNTIKAGFVKAGF